MQIFILNGGKGTRVKSISKNKPKCMIEFNGIPFINYQINLLYKKGFKEIVFCLGYKSKKIINHLKKLKLKGLDINYVVEKKTLGTAGALINAKKKMKNFFFVTYGDSFLDIDYKKIFFKHQKKKNECCITIVNKKLIKNHKSNVLIRNKKIVEYGYSSKCNYIDYGAIIFSKKFFLDKKILKMDLKSIINDLIEKKKLTYYKIKKKFLHIGTIKGIREFRKSI